MGVVGLDHVALPVRDPVAMMAFYGALGFELPDEAAWRRAENPRLTVACGDQKLNLHAPEEWRDPAFTLRAPAARPRCAARLRGPVLRVGGRPRGAAGGAAVRRRHG